MKKTPINFTKCQRKTLDNEFLVECLSETLNKEIVLPSVLSRHST
jgi:hypothetical protein